MSSQLSYIMGDLSGLQGHLFDVPSKHAARRLRARSFRISLTAEAAALRVLDTLGWSKDDHLLLSAAGKFIVRGPELDSEWKQRVEALAAELQQGQFTASNATLRFSLVQITAAQDEPALTVHNRLQRALQQEKLRPAARFMLNGEGWRTGSLPALEPPCAICQHRTGVASPGNNGLVCVPCAEELKVGSALPRATWAELHQGGTMGKGLAGYQLAFSKGQQPSTGAAHAYPLGQRPGGRGRSWARHVPVDPQGHPLDFGSLAEKAKGMPALGVLKADGDSMGVHMATVLQNQGWEGLRKVSEELADHFSTGLDNLLRDAQWNHTYVVFAGGDDMLLVGPWDQVLHFAGVFRNSFQERFGASGLTLSAGMAVVKPRHPIASAVNLAEAALEQAKTTCAIGAQTPKDQMAAFGQVWKWKDHAAVLEQAERITSWVEGRAMPRGWLHHFAQLMQDQLNDPGGLATAHLAYHIGRNLPRQSEPGVHGTIRNWADDLLNDLKAMRSPLTRCAPAILQFAITATRTGGEN